MRVSVFNWSMSEKEILNEFSGKFPTVYVNGEKLGGRHSLNKGIMTIETRTGSKRGAGNHIFVKLPYRKKK